MNRDPRTERAFLGVGWGFPPAVSSSGEIVPAAYEEDVRQAIGIILGTNRGERVMRPEFGAGLKDFVFEPVSVATMKAVETRVREALIDWEPRIDVESVTVTTDRAVRNKLLIGIRYRVRKSNTLHNLVYPFYLLEGARA